MELTIQKLFKSKALGETVIAALAEAVQFH